ncbi:MAG: KamA family radical SAM protein [Deltaproteobacteria bacterium]|nr:KamA family radical SAM protein [Deltaproteobacteria bacterium]MCB9786496.1 KamA family radical SAM protein [Deltaproteobacteria bacterium]
MSAPPTTPGPPAQRRGDLDVQGCSPRGPWADVDERDWTDWRWQQQHRIRTLRQLERVVDPSPGEVRAIEATADRFRMAITPYYAALMDPDDPECPVRRQAVPHLDELTVREGDLADPLGEEGYMPVPGITHRYPDRVLYYVTHNCPVYCRHCTRKRKVADPRSAASHDQLDLGMAYIQDHPEVRDVLVSGGDPLSLSDDRLDALLGALAQVPHVEMVRLCTRNPVTLPFRLTEALVSRLRAHQPVFVHTHFNHPRECTPEAARCLRMLADAGFSVANQMVLLRGVNDDADVVREVNHWLLRQRCRPYYLFQADLAEGISHFRTPVAVGLEILRALRGHTSGMASPHYVIDAPGGGGKIPLVPDYGLRREQDTLVFENYLGQTYRYPAD